MFILQALNSFIHKSDLGEDWRSFGPANKHIKCNRRFTKEHHEEAAWASGMRVPAALRLPWRLRSSVCRALLPAQPRTVLGRLKGAVTLWGLIFSLFF